MECSGTGIRTYAVRSSADGYTTNLTAVYGVPTTNVTVQAGNIFYLKKDITTPQNRNIILLGGATFTNMITPITFRFYAWNAEPGVSGTFSIDNVNFIGSSAPITTGITETSKTAIAVYPNPSNGLFTADLTSVVGKTSITVYDIVGNVILAKEALAGAKQSIDLSNRANGSYFVTVKSDAETITKKIIIAK